MICNKKDCTGCFACYNICPKNAIKMIHDDNGFIYPEIDIEKCINCNLCKKVCPAINKLEYQEIQSCYAAQRKNINKLNESSSGGVASVFAESIVKNGGIVYGATYEKSYQLHFIRVDNLKDINKLKGSKYVHCYIEDSYKNIKKDLINKKTVLFIGTPCQIAGLKLFLMKDYDNLICVDLICHGVPSQKYLKDELDKNIDINKITGLTFRNNNNFMIAGKNNNKVIINIPIEKSRYLRGFLDCFFLRENCYKCKYANPKRISDITIGDFWGIESDSKFYQNKSNGISVILINNTKGNIFFNKCKKMLNLEKRNINEAIN